jgi:hypothetical protein
MHHRRAVETRVVRFQSRSGGGHKRIPGPKERHGHHCWISNLLVAILFGIDRPIGDWCGIEDVKYDVEGEV